MELLILSKYMRLWELGGFQTVIVYDSSQNTTNSTAIVQRRTLSPIAIGYSHSLLEDFITVQTSLSSFVEIV